MQRISVSDVVRRHRFTKAPVGMMPYLEIGDIDLDNKSYSLKDKGSVPGAVVACKDAILVSTVRPTRGAITMLRDDNVAVSSAFATLCVDESICSTEYLFYALNSTSFFQYLGAHSKGATYPTCSKADVLNYSIPLYSPERQARIVEVLDHCSAVIKARKQQLLELDELVKSRFVEMFGDPVDNDKNWRTEVLSSICSTIVDCPHSTPSYTTEDTGYMCIRTSIVKKNRILWDQIEYIPEHEYLQRIQRKKPEKGDIVYTREGAILGIAAMIDRDCNVALGQRSMLLSPNTSKCSPQFLSTAMNFDSFLRKALGGISGSASPHINVGDIKAFSIIVPPIELQKQFAAFVEQTDKSKLAVQQSLEKLETLKKSLMQQYFG